jgi:WD40 repeat protein
MAVLDTEYRPHFDASVLLALGCVDSRVHLKEFTYAQVRAALASSAAIVDPDTDAPPSPSILARNVGILTGHEDWINCLAFSEPYHSTDTTTSIMLASGSQDSKIRLWRIDRLGRKTLTSDGTEVGTGSGAEAIPEDTLLGSSMDDGSEGSSSDEEGDEEEQGGSGGEGSGGASGAVKEDEEEDSGEARCAFTVLATTTTTSASASSGTDPSVPPSAGVRYAVYLEALLVGHEDWVTAVQFTYGNTNSSDGSCTIISSDGSTGKVDGCMLRLFSTSMDRNMLIWEPEAASGVWVPVVRIGDIGGNLGGSVGGNLLGFVGGLISPSGRYILGVGYGGSFHLWRVGSEAEGFRWQPVPFLTGHFGAVTDICWGVGGTYLVSVSADQTSRLHARVSSRWTPPNDVLWDGRSGSSSRCGRSESAARWREVSRPQVSPHVYIIIRSKYLIAHPCNGT